MKSLFILSLMLLVSCSTRKAPISAYEVSVDAISDQEFQAPQSFVLFSDMKDVSDEDLSFRRNAGVIAAAMEKRGYRMYKGDDLADIVILVSYDTSDPKLNVETVNRPKYQYKTVNVNDQFGKKVGTISGLDKQNFAETRSFNTYQQRLVLRALDSKTKKPLWKVTAVSEDTNSDITNAIPFLMRATYPETGKTSKTFSQVAASDINFLKH
jgi:hypothetical protein